MSKKKTKKVVTRMALPGATSWGSLWLGIGKALRSKKFLAWMGASATAASMGDWGMVFNLTMVYLGAQGAVDVAGKFKR